MNNEDNHYMHFILNEDQPNPPQNKIYTIKYFTLILPFVFQIFRRDELVVQLKSNHNLFLISYFATIITFLISCFSQKIGHRRLFLLSYGIEIAFFFTRNILKFKIQNPYIYFIEDSFNFLIFIQVRIQIFGNWQYQYGRIFIECFLIYQIYTIWKISKQKLLEKALKYWIDIVIKYVLIVLQSLNTLLNFKKINNFKPPESISVYRDFVKSLVNLKILIFSLLFGSSYFLTFIISQYNVATQGKIMIISTVVLLIILILYILFAFKLRYIDYYATLFTFQASITAILIGFITIILIEFGVQTDYSTIIILIITLIIVASYQMFAILQYQQIFLNIGIRNIDFATSLYSLILFVINNMLYQFFQNEKNLIHFDLDKIKVISILMAIVIISSIIIYKFFEINKYFKITNRSIVEQNLFQIEID